MGSREDYLQANQRLKEHMLRLARPDGWTSSIETTRTSVASIANAPWMKSIKAVYLVAHGTSFASSRLIESWVNHIARVPAVAVHAFRFAEYADDYLLDPASTLVIGVSCSGDTASVVRSLERANERGATTMLISSLDDSEGARISQHRLLTMAQIEKQAGVNAYSVSHLYIAYAGYEFAIALGQAQGTVDDGQAAQWHAAFDEAVASLKVLPALFDEMGSVAAEFGRDRVDVQCVAGTGPNMGTAVEGALKICEFSWMFGAAEELEDFAHGRFREVDDRSLLLLLAPNGPAIGKTLDLLAGCDVSKTPAVVITDAPSEALRKLAARVIEMPALPSEYVTPFTYIFPLWFYGWHVMNNSGGLVGAKRHDLLAVDINFARHFDASGSRIHPQ